MKKTKTDFLTNALQNDEVDDPFAPKSRNVVKEAWDEFMGRIYSWYYSVSSTTPARPTGADDD